MVSRRPLLSILVVFFNMRREAPRTLHSLTQSYQRDLHGLDYEVIAIDNGSSEPLDEELVTSFGEQFRYHRVDFGSVSPSAAINSGAALAKGEYLMICIDGARILSPGILRGTAMATRMHPSPVIATIGWHLGSELQGEAARNGYDRDVEDRLLADCSWEQDGYRLFEISCLAPSSKDGWFLPFEESNCVTISRALFDELGGFDEEFRAPGGGLVNLDYLERACAARSSQLIVLLGEGTFHQFHGGVATNVTPRDHPWPSFAREYERLRGREFRKTDCTPLFVGSLPPAVTPFLHHSARAAHDHWLKTRHQRSRSKLAAAFAWCARRLLRFRG